MLGCEWWFQKSEAAWGVPVGTTLIVPNDDSVRMNVHASAHISFPNRHQRGHGSAHPRQIHLAGAALPVGHT